MCNAIQDEKIGTTFISTRFGNVVGSRGSVIQLFTHQIENGGPVILTDSRMTRFIMTLEESVRLVMESMILGRGGEVFVTKMPVISIKSLAVVMIEMLAPYFGFNPDQIKIEEVGARPGEKMYEELTNEEEIRRSSEMDELIVIFPAFSNIYQAVDYRYANQTLKEFKKVYHSANEDPMSHDDILKFLLKPNVLPNKIQNRLKKNNFKLSKDK